MFPQNEHRQSQGQGGYDHQASDVEAASPKSWKNEEGNPFHPFVWRTLLVSGAVVYGSYSILIHLCEVDGKLPFRSTSMNFLLEVCKLGLSLVMLSPEVHAGKVSLPSLSTAAPYAIPGFLYFLNNNLGVHLQLEMDPATYQVLSNLKILSTAILYRIILQRYLSRIQWTAIALLVLAGVSNTFGGLQQVGSQGTSAGVPHISMKGVGMILLYCTISGLSGVYSELILKSKYEMSIHVQNGLLYSFGSLLNLCTWLLTAAKSESPGAFAMFEGFTLYTWLLILTQSFIGLMMSAIMKHGNNIIRLFLISSAMLVTTVLSMLIFQLQLNLYFATSFALVLMALYLYHK